MSSSSEAASFQSVNSQNSSDSSIHDQSTENLQKGQLDENQTVTPITNTSSSPCAQVALVIMALVGAGGAAFGLINLFVPASSLPSWMSAGVNTLGGQTGMIAFAAGGGAFLLVSVGSIIYLNCRKKTEAEGLLSTLPQSELEKHPHCPQLEKGQHNIPSELSTPDVNIEEDYPYTKGTPYLYNYGLYVLIQNLLLHYPKTVAIRTSCQLSQTTTGFEEILQKLQDVLPAEEESQRCLDLPFVIGTPCISGLTHYILLFIDRKNGLVEYYDSFGKQHSLEGIAQYLTTFYSKPFSVQQKIQTPLQQDGFRCGWWALYFLENRLKNPQVDFNLLQEHPYLESMITLYQERTKAIMFTLAHLYRLSKEIVQSRLDNIQIPPSESLTYKQYQARYNPSTPGLFYAPHACYEGGICLSGAKSAMRKYYPTPGAWYKFTQLTTGEVDPDKVTQVDACISALNNEAWLTKPEPLDLSSPLDQHACTQGCRDNYRE